MTKRELWLKLFSVNDTALACAIHLCERYVTSESLEEGKDFIEQKKEELNEIIPEDVIAEVFNINAAPVKAESKEKVCSVCGSKIVWEHPDVPGLYMSSSDDIPDWPICHSCMMEHCCSTNCLQCEHGTYPDCRFLPDKKVYMEGNSIVNSREEESLKINAISKK